MSLSKYKKAKINTIIFRRAYEIENKLAEGDFLRAKLAGIKPEQVRSISLKLAVKELKKQLNNI